LRITFGVAVHRVLLSARRGQVSDVAERHFQLCRDGSYMDAVDSWETPSIELVGAKRREHNKFEPTHPSGTEHHVVTFLGSFPSIGVIDHLISCEYDLGVWKRDRHPPTVKS
jgi:hypothetical protein